MQTSTCNERDEEYLCVVTAPGDGDKRFVVTAYFTTNIKKEKSYGQSESLL